MNMFGTLLLLLFFCSRLVYYWNTLVRYGAPVVIVVVVVHIYEPVKRHERPYRLIHLFVVVDSRSCLAFCFVLFKLFIDRVRFSGLC